MNEDLIGKLYFDVKNNSMVNFEELLMNGSHKNCKLSVHITYVTLMDDQILVAHPNSIRIYDKDFYLVKRIEKISGLEFMPRCIQINSTDKFIYILDKNCRILMTDLNFNLISSVGSKGTENDKFLLPVDMCYINEKLFACDLKKHVKIYSKDLNSIEYIFLDYVPLQMRATSSTIAINGFDKFFYFYNLENFRILRRYKYEGKCVISQISSLFYISIPSQDNIKCFSEKGIYKNEINTTTECEFIHYYGSIIMVEHCSVLKETMGHINKTIGKIFHKYS